MVNVDLRRLARCIFAAGCIVVLNEGLGPVSVAHAQSAGLPGGEATPVANEDPLKVPVRVEVANQRLGSTGTWKLPPQPFMREIYWRDAAAKLEMLPFFRDSLVQIVIRSYYMTRNNFDGTRSQAWTGGGWIAYRSGLVANTFGIQAAFYTSQKLYGPADEGGTKLLTPDQNPINVFGQAYGFAQISDQEIRAGRMLVNTPLINPSDSRMVANTFEGLQLVSLPVQGRSYD